MVHGKRLRRNFCGVYDFTECMHYPITAKYHMNLEGVPMELDSRWKDKRECTEYEKLVVRQGYDFEKKIMEFIDSIRKGKKHERI